MKNIAVIGMLCAFMIKSDALKIHNVSSGIAMDEDSVKNLDDNLDSLMDKYDDNEQKAQDKKVEKKDNNKKDGASASEVQDMELKILSGNNLASTSSKADDDDLYNTILEKYSNPAKDDKSLSTISKDQAMEASADVWASKRSIDSFEAMS